MVADGDGDFDAEQAHIEWAYDCLSSMRTRAEALLSEPVGDPDWQFALARRVAVLQETGRALCFGRIDEVTGETWHIGRRHVEDAVADPVVVEWRAPVAVAFYRATVHEPLGLSRRRQFVVDGRKLLSMADDVFDDGASDDQPSGPRVRGRDALLVELERSRTGEMLDIVATIQAEQDEVIRAAREGVMAVQGGPGTGKTAVGLHRAAYLLYGDDRLARAGVLVVGPNRTFLRYIAHVLPSLGEEAVVQTTMRDLVPDLRVETSDGVEAQRVKGDPRMADVLARALAARRRPVERSIDVAIGLARVQLPAEGANALLDQAAAKRLPYNAGRDALRNAIARELYDRYVDSAGGRLRAVAYDSVGRELRAAAEVQVALDRMWPTVSAPALVRELLSNVDRLRTAADGLLDEAEQRAIHRPPAARADDEPWTESDVPLLDEAQALLTGGGRTYGHVVCDEAQDLSPMQLRMLARRCPSGSMTLLGDLAQGSSVWAPDDWAQFATHLATPQGFRVAELRIGYRAPGQVLDFAAALLPAIAPQVAPTESVRPGRTSPTVLSCDSSALVDAVVGEVRALAARHAAIGVIVPAGLHADLAGALRSSGLDSVDAAVDGLDHRVSVLTAVSAKGLEFDAVVVVEPSLLAGDAPRGLRLLYVAMTRPTQHLSVVHARPLPGPLVTAGKVTAR